MKEKNFKSSKFLKKRFPFFIIVFFVIIAFSHFVPGPLSEEKFVCGDLVMDIDGNKYKTVEIGDQCWFAENLRVTSYQDGTEIIRIEDHDEWWRDEEGAFTLYDYTAPIYYQGLEITSEEEMLNTYGYLYNFNAVMNEKGLCPPGWSVPSDEDWKILEIELGMDPEEAETVWHRGTTEGAKLKGGQGLWDEVEVFGLSGFNALPAGYRRNYGDFGNMGTNANFWTSTPVENQAIRRNLYWEDSGIYRIMSSQGNGLSVRCLKDDDGERVVRLKAEAVDNKISLSWHSNNKNVEKYIVFRGVKKEGPYEKIGIALEENYKDIVGFGATYYYFIDQIVRGQKTGSSKSVSVVTDPFLGWSCGDPVNHHGESYQTVRIGSQCWFAENLKTVKYNNGDKIFNPIEDSEWREAGNNKKGAYACYDHNPANCRIYGALYNVYALEKGLCPPGWSVPSDEDWKILEIELGMDPEEVDLQYWRGAPVGVKLMGEGELWREGGRVGDKEFGSSGFNALPAGYRMSGGRFSYLGVRANIWSSTIRSSAWRRTIIFDSSGGVRRTAAAKNFGFSVRCIKINKEKGSVEL